MYSIRSKFKEKLSETLKAVFPILAIVLLLCFTIAPIPPSILMTFLIGAVLLIVGTLFFNVGVELSMTPIGERVGSIMTKSKKLFVIILISFIMGFVITISEPDLQVLAQQVPSIPNLVLIMTVAMSVLEESRWLDIKTQLQKKLKIDAPGGGIAFIVPLSSIGGKKTLQFLLESQDYKKEEESTLKNTTHDLIVVIAEQGYTNLIMDAAREAGAYGGTVIYAKGTGIEAAEKFMGVSLAAEKD